MGFITGIDTSLEIFRGFEFTGVDDHGPFLPFQRRHPGLGLDVTGFQNLKSGLAPQAPEGSDPGNP